MAPSNPPLDLTDQDREQVQLGLAEIDGTLGPAKQRARAAELVLLRKIFEYARQYRHYFPPKLQDVIRTLGRRSHLELLPAEQRAELEQNSRSPEEKFEVISDRKATP